MDAVGPAHDSHLASLHPDGVRRGSDDEEESAQVLRGSCCLAYRFYWALGLKTTGPRLGPVASELCTLGELFTLSELSFPHC